MIHLYEELGDTSRRRLLSELRSGPKTVSDLVVATFLKQPNVSNHLARMRSKGILRCEKVGRQVFYTFASPQIESAVKSAFVSKENSVGEFDREDASKRYAKAATQGNEAICIEVLEQALRERLGLLDIYQDILLPAMIAIGTWYNVEAIDTAQEHMASAITERMMARVVQHSIAARPNGRTALLGCGPNSWHVIGLRMVGDYLQLLGWRILFLGANMPHKCFLNAVEQHNPDLVLVSCVAHEGLDCGISLIQALSAKRTLKNAYIIGVGGKCVSEHSQKFILAGADFTCSCLRRFASEIVPELEKNPKQAFRDEPRALVGEAI